MKIIITESKYIDGIKSMIGNMGLQSAIDFVGGINSFNEVLKIESPYDFLQLFDNLDVVESEKNPEMMLYRFEKGKNLIVHYKPNNTIFVKGDIWEYFKKGKGRKKTIAEIKDVIEKWFVETYELNPSTVVLAKSYVDIWIQD